MSIHRLPLSAPDPTQNHVSNDLDKRIAEEREDTLLHVKTQASALRENATDLDEALSEVETFVATIKNCAVEVTFHSFVCVELLPNVIICEKCMSDSGWMYIYHQHIQSFVIY